VRASWPAAGGAGGTIHSSAQTIAAVDLTRAFIHMIGLGVIYVGNQTNWADFIMSAVFASPTSVTLRAQTNVNYVPISNAAISVQAEVVELYEAPKSIQRMQGNGAASQTIAQVDPDKVEIIMASQGGTQAGGNYLSQINATSIVWASALASAHHYQVIEHY
jgi:hypothetical protein